jgi:pSer/pThr/pTyr-binding forkhead associated (FHA) protein
MAERNWVVGNSSDCDIRVEGRTVSAKHCRLTARGESFLLEDLQSTNGTYVAGQRITHPRIVRRGEQVTLGRNVPLPWPAPVVSISVGRLADNDLVIPLETVSGHHARVERVGNRTFLIDEGSTNGTAINDPLNKIKRSELKPTDAVFLGTHRIAAADLLAALPPSVVQDETFLERTRPEELAAGREQPVTAEVAQPADVQPAVATARMTSPREWFVGIALSAVCATVVFAGARSCRQQDALVAKTPTNNKADAVPLSEPEVPDVPAKVPGPDPKLPPDAALVRKSAEAVVMLALRVDRKVVLTNVTGWACGPNRVICPTSALADMESVRPPETPEVSLVACLPTSTIAILDHKAGDGEADGFSVATLEAPLNAVCQPASDAASACVPGQKLAMLATTAKDDDPKSIVQNLVYLTVDRVEHGSDRSATMYKCRFDGSVGGGLGSPVFDTSGRVVGCAQFVSGKAYEAHVTPIHRLSSLLKTDTTP